MTSRVSPDGSTQSPTSMPANAGPQRLRHLADRHAERAGQPAIDLDVELRLLSLGRQTDVDRAGHLLHLVDDLVGEPGQRVGVAALQLQLDLLLPLVEAGADRRGDAAKRVELPPDVGEHLRL